MLRQSGSPLLPVMTESWRSVYVPHVATTNIDVSFEDIKYTVRQGRNRTKEILKGVSGHFKNGELTGILGPSGAGKSSLLNILTGFETNGISGNICANGVAMKKGRNTARKQSAYIMQEDKLYPYFTVDELMNLSSKLKIGHALAPKARQYVVDDTLEAVGLTECKKTMCKKLSGGQKKRLSIALELIDNPSILYLDEPTTGLDSSSCLQVMMLLSRMAHQGKTIICTIHQPSAKIFEMMDHVYVVSEGRCIYQGSSSNVIPFLKSVNLPCPQYHNPADFLLDVISGEFGRHNDELILANTSVSWRNEIKTVHLKSNENGTKMHKSPVYIPPPTEIYRILTLIKCISLQLHREWYMSYLKLALSIILGFFIGYFFENCGQNGNTVVSNIGYLMIIIVYTSFMQLVPATLKFPARLQILRKERFNNWYSFKSYFIAFLIVNTPMQLFLSYIFVAISFLMSSQIIELNRILLLYGSVTLVVVTSEYFGIALGTASNPANAIFVGSVFLAVCILFAGYAIFLTHMPTVFYYFAYASYMRYAFESLVVAIYGFGREPLHCPEEVLYCHVKFPTNILTELGVFDKNIIVNFIALGCYALSAIILSYFWVRRQVKKI